MSELQLGLLGIGVLVVIAVFGYNKWQEHKYRREAERNLKSRHVDVLLLDANVPAEQVREPAAAAAAPSAERIEPEMQMRAAAQPSTAAMLSESLDYIVAIEAGSDIEGAAFTRAGAEVLRSFSKRVLLEGYSVREQRWEPLAEREHYAMLRAGLQLSDRRGPVRAEELAAFGAAAHSAAAAAGVRATLPDKDAALALAGDLDRFCREVDILVAIGIVGAQGGALAGTRIRGLAEAAGFVLEGDGRFRRRDEQGRVIFELASLDGAAFRSETMRSLSVSGISLELDVPRAPGGIGTFEQFRGLIQHFIQGLDGRLVDDNRKPMSTSALDQIRGQIEAVHKAMEARGIAAGSAEALRLFS